MHTDIRLLLCTTLVFHAFGQEVKKRYEFENVVGKAGSARTPWRSDASGNSSLRMFKGDQIQLTLCADVARTLSIDGLIYSNDGESDTIDVSVKDSTGVFFPYGTVFTEETSGGWGKFWNSFKSSAPFSATPLFLTPHTNTTIMITVNAADCYGSEFDAFDVTLSANVANETLWCDAKLIYAATPTPCAVRIDNPELTSTLTPTLEMTTSATTPTQTSEMATLEITPSKITSSATTQTQASEMATSEMTPTEITSSATTQTRTSEMATSEMTSSVTTQTQTSETTTSEITTSESKTRITTPTRTQTSEMATSETTPSEITSSVTTQTQTSEMATSDMTPTEITSSATTQTRTSEMATSEMIPSEMTSSAATQTSETTTSEITTSESTTRITTPTRTSEMTTLEFTTAEMTQLRTSVKTPTSATPMRLIATSVGTNEPITDAAIRNRVQQNSFQSDCKDESNVKIRFKPSVLKNTILIAREQTDVRHRGNTTTTKAGRSCETQIWQIGSANNRNDDLGPGIMTSSMTYAVGNDTDFRTFPGIIQKGKPNQLDVKYYIPRKFNVNSGKLEFTLGLNNVNTDKTIGIQYLKKAKVNPSDVIYRTFSLSNKVNEWKIPSKALSSSLENVLTLHFDRLEPGPVNIDYLKLAYNPRKWGTQPVTLLLDSTRNLRALKYRENARKKNKDVEIPKGMNLYVDGKRIDGEMEKVVLMHKPNLQIFAISENGEINVNHVTTSGRRQNRRTIGVDDENQQKGASGFFIGNPDNNIETVAFNTQNNDIKITYANDTFVTFTLQYSALETRLVVTDTNIADGSVTFFSTHISDGLAGANDVIVDGGVAREHVMDQSVGNLSGTRFKFVKTNPDQTFDVSDETEIVFLALLSG